MKIQNFFSFSDLSLSNRRQWYAHTGKGQPCQCHPVISSNTRQQHWAVSMQQPVPSSHSLFFFTITLCPYPPFLSPLYSRQNMPLFAYLLGESKREKEQGGRNIFLMQYPAKGCVILRMNSLLKVFGLWPNIYYTILSASILFLIYLKSFVSCVTLDTFLTWTKH